VEKAGHFAKAERVNHARMILAEPSEANIKVAAAADTISSCLALFSIQGISWISPLNKL
jgi:hypothetical protein